MATTKKAGDKQTGGRAQAGKAAPAKATTPAAAGARKSAAAAPKAAAKSAAKPVVKPAAAKNKPLIAPATTRIAKEVAAKAVKAVKKKVGQAVSSITAKAKSQPVETRRPSAKSAAKPAASAKAAPARSTSAKPASASASSRSSVKKTLSAPAAAPVAKSARAKGDAPRAAAAKPAAKKPLNKTAAGALAGDKASLEAAVKEFSGSESFRPEEDIAETNPVDVRERFFHEHRGGPPPAPETRELPNEYGDTRIVLLVRDPEWVYAYWEINDDTRQEMKLSRNGHTRRMVIRLYKTTDRAWPDEGAHYFFDIDVSPYALNWYIKLPEPGQQWCAELGIFDEQNNYTPICRSNVIDTPRSTISEETDSEWMVVEETFRKLSKLAGPGGRQVAGLNSSRGASESLLRQLQRQVTGMLRVEGGGMSSGALYSGSLAEDGRGVAVGKDFWLQVHTEVILYGATETDARVTVQERPVKLNSDGTFSIRFALPDGEQELKVHATNADGDMERSITPVVTKRTRDK